MGRIGKVVKNLRENKAEAEIMEIVIFARFGFKLVFSRILFNFVGPATLTSCAKMETGVEADVDRNLLGKAAGDPGGVRGEGDEPPGPGRAVSPAELSPTSSCFTGRTPTG